MTSLLYYVIDGHGRWHTGDPNFTFAARFACSRRLRVFANVLNEDICMKKLIFLPSEVLQQLVFAFVGLIAIF